MLLLPKYATEASAREGECPATCGEDDGFRVKGLFRAWRALKGAPVLGSPALVTFVWGAALASGSGARVRQCAQEVHKLIRPV